MKADVQQVQFQKNRSCFEGLQQRLSKVFWMFSCNLGNSNDLCPLLQYTKQNGNVNKTIQEFSLLVFIVDSGFLSTVVPNAQG